MNARLQALGLPALAVALVTGVLGIQLANGGSEFEPTRTADPCATRPVTSLSTGIEGMTERLVLIGIDNAACTLGVSREALTLELAGSGQRTDAEVDALRQGLLDAVSRLEAEDALPPASDLVDEALDSVELNRFLEAAIRALPDSAVNAALKTDDVLRRTIEDLDVRALLDNLDDEDDLTAQIEDAVVPAIKDSLVARLRDQF